MCEGPIELKECLKALKSMPNNKTPGTDGFPCEISKFFRQDIIDSLIDSLSHAYIKEKLSIDQKHGIISLSPKKGKDPLLLKNWRPITLLNTDYKILAKVLAI